MLMLSMSALIMLSFFLFGAGAARAMPLADTLCSNNCYSAVVYNGISVHGIGSDFTIDNPSTGTNESYIKDITISNGSGYETAGITKNVNCGSGLWYFYINDNVGYHCIKQVPTQDINTTITIKLSYYASNGGGGFVYILSRSGSQCNPCSYADSNLTAAFTSDAWEVGSLFASFTGDKVWGGEWVNNRYFNGTSWNFDTTSPNYITLTNINGSVNLDSTVWGCPVFPQSGDSPPQMCMKDPPDGTHNNGGIVYSCIYDNTNNTCTLGS